MKARAPEYDVAYVLSLLDQLAPWREPEARTALRQLWVCGHCGAGVGDACVNRHGAPYVRLGYVAHHAPRKHRSACAFADLPIERLREACTGERGPVYVLGKIRRSMLYRRLVTLEKLTGPTPW